MLQGIVCISIDHAESGRWNDVLEGLLFHFLLIRIPLVFLGFLVLCLSHAQRREKGRDRVQRSSSVGWHLASVFGSEAGKAELL